MRTEQDKINRKEANQRYYKLEENKQQKRDYMKEYRNRPTVKAKYNESRRIARLNWTRTKHGKKWSQDYMKEYRKRPEVKARYHEYYVKNKAHWGEITKAKKNNWGGVRQENEDIKRLHEKWAQKNGYRNEDLHGINSERFANYEK